MTQMNLASKEYNQSTVIESVTDKKEIIKRYRVGLRRISESYLNTLAGSTTISYGGRPVRALPADIVRIASELKNDDLSDLLIRNIILNFIVSSENHSAYSGVLLVDMISKNSKSLSTSFSRRVELSHISQLVRKYVGNGVCSQIISSILEINPNSSLEFRINKHNSKFSVLSDYSMKIMGYLPSMFELQAGRLKGFFPMFVDGKIEKVSELDSILRTSHESGQTILLMAREFSPDVISTLSHNYNLKKLNVVPFVVTEETHEKLDNANIKVFDYQNSFELKTFDASNLKKSYDGNFHSSWINLHGARGIDRHVTIDIPVHFQHQAGLIEDRVRSGITFALETAKNGIVLNSLGVPVAGKKQYDTALRIYDSIVDFENNLGGLIVLD